MSRISSEAFVAPTPAQFNSPEFINALFAQGAEDVDIELQLEHAAVALVRGELSQIDWDVQFIHAGGAGHGHSFTVWMDIFNNDEVINSNQEESAPSTALSIIVYIAADAEALGAARQRALSRWQARLARFNKNATAFKVMQTWLCGAAKGRRVMGVELLSPNAHVNPG